MLRVPRESTRSVRRVLKPSSLAAVCLSLSLFTGLTACGGTSAPKPVAAKESGPATRAAFCAASGKLVDQMADLTNSASLVAVLKANRAEIDALADQVPKGSIHQDAETLVDGYRSVVASGTVAGVSSPAFISAANAIGTYCGVATTGTTPPGTEASGRADAFCAAAVDLAGGIKTAADPTAALDFVEANQAKLGVVATEAPAAVQADARDFVAGLRAALTDHDPADLQSPEVATAERGIGSYCVIDQ